LPRLGAQSTHILVKSEGAGIASRTIRITPFTISSKGSHYPIKIGVQKDILSNKIDIYLKHMQNNEMYMCLYEIIRCKHNFSYNAFR
ncbi:hypothetical protein BHM03_00039557, partial [Ensete ventricosum]